MGTVAGLRNGGHHPPLGVFARASLGGHVARGCAKCADMSALFLRHVRAELDAGRLDRRDVVAGEVEEHVVEVEEHVIFGLRSSRDPRESIVNLEAHVVRLASHVMGVEEDVRFRASDAVFEEQCDVGGDAHDVSDEENVVCGNEQRVRLVRDAVGGALSGRSEDRDVLAVGRDAVGAAGSRRVAVDPRAPSSGLPP
jgi:hypothetical protein